MLFYRCEWTLSGRFSSLSSPLHAPLPLKRFLECPLTAPLLLTRFASNHLRPGLSPGRLAALCSDSAGNWVRTVWRGHICMQDECRSLAFSKWAFTRYDRPTDRSARVARPRLRSTGRSDQSERSVRQTAEPPTSVNQINVAC